MVLVSIYGTVYNNAQLVNKTITTLIDSLPEFESKYEVVIVDNFSIDGTWEILQHWAKNFRNIKLIREKSSRGKGRNIALKHTEGEYVLSIDFDVCFKKEFGMLISKFEKLCSRWTILGPYCFSTRKTLISIGGWRDLNFGEDWEMVARAIANKVKIKNVLTVPFSVNQVSKLRESRYVKNRIGYGIRKIKNFIDSCRGYNIHPKIFVNHFLPKKLTQIRPSSIIIPLFYPIAMINRFAYSKGLTNAEYVHMNEEYVLPEEIGFSSDYFFQMYSNINIIWRVVRERLREITQRARNLEFLISKEKNLIVAYRNYDIVKEYMEYLLV